MYDRHTQFLVPSILGLVISMVAPVRAATVDFNRDIRPILTQNCFKCHGFDPAGRKGGLRLDVAAGTVKKLKTGHVPIVPGKPDDSELVHRITSLTEDEVMPPPESGKKLTPEQIATLRQWVAEGGAYAKHWSFEPPVKAALPAVKNAGWPKNPIDYFVLARLEREGLSPSPQADKTTLARRVALDITGLPPTPEQLDSFLKDGSPNAYEHLVDNLLASPAYGEHWGRRWLDLARYADTRGYEKDRRRTIWPYRDWVIRAFNADMPYDQFTREQLAGDLLANPTNDQLVATAFHRNTLTNEEGGVDREEYRIAAVKDRVDTTVQVWMGLTMGCAKCHTHKYDPIATREYYQFYAFFNQTQDANLGDESPTLPTPTAEEAARSAQLTGEIAAIEQKLHSPDPQLAAAQLAWEEQMRRPGKWVIAEPAKMQSASGSRLSLNPDGSILAKGDGPAKETYTLTFTTALTQVTAIRIEALPDPANPRGGVGRSQNDGNFVLTGITLTVRAPDGQESIIPLTKAAADFSQQKYPVDHALHNPDPKHHGWAVSPRLTEPHVAVFSTGKPQSLPPGSELKVVLDHQFEYATPGFSLGKFRISATDDGAPQPSLGIPKNVVDLVKKPAAQRTAAQQQQVWNYFSTVAPELRTRREQLAKLKSELSAVKPTATPILRELAQAKRRVTRLHNRGNFLDPGEVVDAGVPEAFPPLPAGAPLNRLGVAQWLCSRENPLTPRVAANRVWAGMFGIGIVETQEDFGTQGTPPSHPELLDFLAVDFREQGWSFKKLVKTIVMSATYQQSSHVSPELAERDRFNRLLARGPRFRPDAEVIRDQALAVSGLLSHKMFGPSVMPWQPPGMWKSTYSNEQWQTSVGEDQFRRGLYTFIKRTTPYPSMITFDGTSREYCTVRRSRTNTPLQALVTLNDPVFVQCAQALARRMAAADGASPEAQIALGARTALLREPSPREVSVLTELYRQRLAFYQADLADAEKFATVPLGGLPQGADAPRLAALTAVANVILNLDEFLTKG
jgi:hypothetical protein